VYSSSSLKIYICSNLRCVSCNLIPNLNSPDLKSGSHNNQSSLRLWYPILFCPTLTKAIGNFTFFNILFKPKNRRLIPFSKFQFGPKAGGCGIILWRILIPCGELGTPRGAVRLGYIVYNWNTYWTATFNLIMLLKNVTFHYTHF